MVCVVKLRNAGTSESNRFDASASHPSSRKGDLIAQADYFEAQGGTILEDRFLQECVAGFERLSSGLLVSLISAPAV